MLSATKAVVNKCNYRSGELLRHPKSVGVLALHGPNLRRIFL
jgi:hypothetical protein